MCSAWRIGTAARTLVACLVISGDRPSLLELRSFCGRRLAAHKIPRAFVVLDRIPLTARGKTDRERLARGRRRADGCATVCYSPTST